MRLGFLADALASIESIVPKVDPDSPDLPHGFFQKSMGFLDIAEKQLLAGDRDGAKSSVRKALMVIDATKELEEKLSPLEKAVDLLIRLDDLGIALRTIEGSGFGVDAAIFDLRRIAIRQERSGHLEERQGDQESGIRYCRARNTIAGRHEGDNPRRYGRSCRSTRVGQQDRR